MILIMIQIHAINNSILFVIMIFQNIFLKQSRFGWDETNWSFTKEKHWDKIHMHIVSFPLPAHRPRNLSNVWSISPWDDASW